MTDVTLTTKSHELRVGIDNHEFKFMFDCDVKTLGQIMISMLNGTAITLGQDPAPMLKDLQEKFLNPLVPPVTVKGPAPTDV